MSLYPPPTSNVTVFNPALFQDFNVGGSYGTIGTSGSLAFPVAQGAETFTNGTNTTIVDNGSITLSRIVGLVQSGVELDASGIAYDNGTTISGATWENLVTKVQAIGAITATSDVVVPPAQSTILNVNNTIQIQNGETATLPHSFVSLSADGGDLRMNLCPNGVTNSYGTAGQVLVSGGSAGSMSWGSGGGGTVGTLNEVLTNGNTTTQGATFTYSPTATTNAVSGLGVVYTNNSADVVSRVGDEFKVSNVANDIFTTLTSTQLSMEDTITEDLTEIKKNYIETFNNVTGNYIALDNSVASPTVTVLDSSVGSSVLSSDALTFTSNATINTDAIDSIAIGSNQTDGILNLGAGASRTETGVINIGNSASINKISIETGSTLNSNSTPAIAIGTSASTKTIKIGNNSNSVHCSSIDLQGSAINNIVASTGAINIGNNQTDGILNLGAGGLRTATGVINIGTGGTSSPCIVNIANGGVTQAGSVNIANTAGAGINTPVSIGTGNNAGSVSIGNPANGLTINCASTTISNNTAGGGTVQIKNAGASSTGSVQIATGGGAGNTTTVSISTGTTSGAVAIGSSSNSTTITGATVRLNDLKVVGNQLNNAVNEATGNIYIGAKQSSGVLFIGAGDAGRTSAGEITIGNNACPVGIMNSGGTNAGSVNIANGTGVNQTTNVNIATNSNSGTITIGGASNTTNLNSATLNIGGNLTMGTGKNITLQPTAGYVAPTADTMLGGITTGTYPTSGSSFSSAKDIATISLVKGTYLLFFTFQAQVTVRPTENFVQFNLASSTAVGAGLDANFRIGFNDIAPTALGFMGSVPLSITTAGTVVLRYFLVGTINSIVLPTYKAVRIA